MEMLRIWGLDLLFPDKGSTEWCNCIPKVYKGSRVMFVILYFLCFRRTAINILICIFVLFQLFISTITIQGNLGQYFQH